MDLAAAIVLHVGDDTCYRIPVMEMSGIVVRRCACSVESVRALLKEEDSISAVAFNSDMFPPEDAVVSAARELCDAPLILFDNPLVECDEERFDVVIEVHAAPSVWAKTLRQAIEDAGKVRERSRQLQADCEAVRERSQSVREMLQRQLISRFDCDRMFFGQDDGVLPKLKEGDGS